MPLISTDHHSLAVGKPQVPGFNEKDLKRSAQNKTFSLFFTDHLLVRLYHEERMQCCSNAATRKQASCQDLVRWKKKYASRCIFSLPSNHKYSSEYRITWHLLAAKLFGGPFMTAAPYRLPGQQESLHWNPERISANNHINRKQCIMAF